MAPLAAATDLELTFIRLTRNSMTILQIDSDLVVKQTELPKVTLASGLSVSPKPFGIVARDRSNLIVTDIINHIVFELDIRARKTRLIAGTGESGFAKAGVEGSLTPLNCPTDVAWTNGDVYVVADSNNHCLKQIDGTTGITSVLAGTGKAGYSGDGGPARLAQLSEPTNVVLDSLGQVIFTDLENQSIRMVNAEGIVSTIADIGNTQDGYPCGIASIGTRIAFITTEAPTVSLISDYDTENSKTVDLRTGVTGAPSAICSAPSRRLVVVYGEDNVVRWFDEAGNQEEELPVDGLEQVLDVTADSCGVVYVSLVSHARS